MTRGRSMPWARVGKAAKVGLVGCAPASVWRTGDCRGGGPGSGWCIILLSGFVAGGVIQSPWTGSLKPGAFWFGCNNGPTSERLKDFGRLSGPCIAWRFRLSFERNLPGVFGHG